MTDEQNQIPHPPTARLPSKLPAAWPRIMIATGIAIVVTIIEHGLKLDTYTLTPTPFTIIGVAISIFLGFRNNTAYQRFWEARSLWGRLINVSRSLGRQFLTLIAPQPDTANRDGHGENRERVSAFQREMVLMVGAYAHALRHHLRDTDSQSDLAGILPHSDVDWLRGQKNVPLALMQLMGERLEWARQQGWIRDADMISFQTSLTEIDAVQGGSEKIKNTPVPVTYAILSHNIVAFFCYFLAFGILDSAKLLTPLVVFLVSYAFFGLDALGEEVTDPFGTDPHDVHLEQLSETIEKNMRQLLAAPTLPMPNVPALREAVPA